MANKKIQATATLFLDTANAKKDAEKFVNDIKQKLKSIETAADKVDVFKDLVGYISQVDKALSALKAKNSDAFNSMFNGIDTNLLKEIEKIFGTTKAQLTQLDQLKTKILNAKSNGSTTDELKVLEQQIKDLYAATGKMDDLKISGRGALETRISKMESALDNFATVWDEVNEKVKQGFGGGPGGTGVEYTKIQKNIKDLQSQLTKSKKLREEFGLLTKAKKQFQENEWLDDSISIEYSVDAIKKLVQEYRAAKSAKEDFEKSGNTSSIEYYQSLVNMAKVALQVDDVMTNYFADDKKARDKFKSIKFEQGSLYSAFSELTDQDTDELFDEIGNNFNTSINTIELKIQQLTSELNSLSSESKAAFNDVGNAVGDAEGKIDSFGKKIIDVSEYISGMSAQLRSLFDVLSQPMETEYKVLINGQDVNIKKGDFDRVSTEKIAETYLSNLDRDAIVSAHSHMGADSGLNHMDLRNIISDFVSGTAKLGATIGKDGIATWNLAGVAMEDIAIAMEKIEQHANKFGDLPVDKVNEIFKSINPKYTDVAKLWTQSELDGLAQYIYDIGQKSTAALAPVERFQNVLKYFVRDIDLDKYKDVLSDFKEENAGPIFNQIMQAEGIELNVSDISKGSLDDVTREIEEQRNQMLELRQAAQVTYSEIEKVAKEYYDTFTKKDSERSGADFFKKYFHVSELPDINQMFTDIEFGERDLTGVTKALASYFYIDPDEMIPSDQINKAKIELQAFLSLTDEIQNKSFSLYGSDGNVEIGKYTERLDVAKAALDALGEQGVLTAAQLEEVQQAFNKSKSHLSEYTTSYTGYGDGYYWHSYEDEKNALEEENKKLQEQMSKQSVSEEELETLRKENGLLQDKLEILQDIADAYGIHITQRARNRYDELVDKEMDSGLTTREEDRMSDLSDTISEADSNLAEFEGTYDRIILKLSNGKNVEILPDDNGLRKLDKISNEYYSGEYNGFEIDDIIFVRKQEQSVIEANNHALNEQFNLQQKINEESKQNVTLYDSTDGQLALFEGISVDAQRAEENIEDLVSSIKKVDNIDGQMNMFDEVDNDIMKINQLLEQEKLSYEEILYLVQQCNKLSQQSTDAFRSGDIDLGDKLFGVTADIAGKLVPTNMIGMGSDSPDKWLNMVGMSAEEAATKLSDLYNRLHMVQSVDEPLEFVESQDKSVASEVGLLDSLLTKINEVKVAIDAKTQAFEQEYVTVDAAVDAELASLQRLLEKLDTIVTQANLVSESLDKIGANSVELNVGDSEEQLASLLTGSNIATEITQLEQLQVKVIEVKNAVIAKTKAFSDEGAVVGQSVGKEVAALMKLSAIVDSITPKVNALIVGLNGLDKETKIVVKDDDSSEVTKPKSPEDKFKADKDNQITSLDTYRKSLQNVDYLTTELRDNLQKLAEDLSNISTPLGLEAFKKDLADIKKQIAAEKSAFDKVNLGYINSEESKLKSSFNKLTDDQQLSLKDVYEDAIAELEHYRTSVEYGKKVELDAIHDVTASLREQISAYQQANKEAQKAQRTATNNQKFGATAEINATSRINALRNKASGEQFASSAVVQQGMADLEDVYDRLLKKREQLANQADISKNDKVNFKNLTTEYNNCASALEKIIKNSEKLSGNGKSYMLGDDFVDDPHGRKAALDSFMQSMNGIDNATIKFKDNFNACTFAIKNGDGTLTQMTATFTDARNEIVALSGETKNATGAIESFWNELKGKFRSIGSYLVASFSFYEVFSVIKSGVNYVKDIDSALTELKKVTDETDASYSRFLKDMAKTGSIIGATVSDLTTMASEWARLGYSMEEAGKLAESTAILLNVSEFTDATTASEALISTMQAFGYVAKDSQHVVDILNEIGNNYAVSSDGLAVALQDSASALMEAGNNLEQSVALVASANKVVQDPNSVGSALRTISLRLRGTSVEVLEEMGEATDGVVESISKMQSKIQALTGVNILTDSGAYKDTYTILNEIGQVWKDMSDIDQAEFCLYVQKCA